MMFQAAMAGMGRNDIEPTGCQDVPQTRKRLRFLLRAIGSLMIAAALSGCAGARISGIATANPAGPPPVDIQVAVAPSPSIDRLQTEDAQDVATGFRLNWCSS